MTEIETDAPVSRREFDELRRDIWHLHDIEAIRRLHHIYGYYMDRLLFNEVISLFSEDCELHFMGGEFRGLEGARRLYSGRLGDFAGRKGMLVDHLMLQDVIDVAPDRRTADARFRCLVQGGVHQSIADTAGKRNQYWHAGIYENTYVRRDGVWKIKVFRYTTVWEADYELGWGRTAPGEFRARPIEHCYPEDPHGPDKLEPMPALFPDNETVPFHYPNPVTGQPAALGKRESES